MPSQSNRITKLQPKELARFGFAHARDLAFDAVMSLWERRRDEGMLQKQLAKNIGRDAGWVSKKLRGPSNWTLEAFGNLVEGLDGELEIIVSAAEDSPSRRPNRTSYDDYGPIPFVVFDDGVEPKTEDLRSGDSTELVVAGDHD